MRRLDEFIDEQIERHGLWKVLAAPATFLVAIGATSVPFMGVYGPLIALGLMVLEALVIAQHSHSRFKAAARRERDGSEVRRILREYILKLADARWRYVKLVEHTAISGGGDTRVSRECVVQITGEAPLHFIELNFWGPQLTERERSNVEPVVRFGPEKARLETIDVHWTREPHWDQISLFIYLPRPVTPSDEPFLLTLDYEWPRMFADLARGRSEKCEWQFLQTPEEFRYVVTLDASVGVKTRPRCIVTGMKAVPACVPEAGSWRIEGVERPGPPANEEVSLIIDPT